MNRGRKTESPSQRVATVSVELVSGLARDWPEHGGYDNLRGAVIYAVYAELAAAYGLFAPRLEQVEPRMPEDVAHVLRFRISLSSPMLALDPYLFGCVHETLSGYHLVNGEVVPSNGRRKAGVHFTPPELADKVVARTVEPLLKALSPNACVLDLRICDPSVGAGAFLLSLVRYLAPRVLLLGLASNLDEAKRLVAIHVARGVDKCPFAVYAAKLALRLECRADRMPADWLDDNIRVGDALVGLDREQFIRFDWAKKREAQPFLEKIYDDAIAAGAQLRAVRMAELSEQARAV
ncbi:MAG: hypothetical protein H0X39_00290 [Actinobacteria bacterium]|nr:hypothetical protein [Gemmatimonadaceae bacterium]MBA3841059.1 hypothetical protein [Actinomycetota bacterium]